VLAAGMLLGGEDARQPDRHPCWAGVADFRCSRILSSESTAHYHNGGESDECRRDRFPRT